MKLCYFWTLSRAGEIAREPAYKPRSCLLINCLSNPQNCRSISRLYEAVVTGLSDCGETSIIIELAARLLKYLHLGHVIALQLGTTKNLKVLAPQSSDCPRYPR